MVRELLDFMRRSRIYARCDELCRQIAVINFNWKKGRFVRHPALCILPFLRRTQFLHPRHKKQSISMYRILIIVIDQRERPFDLKIVVEYC